MPRDGGAKPGLSLSFRSRILLIVLVLGTVPPLLVALGLNRAATRTSESLILSRVQSGLEETIPMIVSRWVSTRTGLLDLADGQAVQQAMGANPVRAGSGATDPEFPSVQGLVALRFTDRDGEAVSVPSLRLPDLPPMEAGPTIPVDLRVYDRLEGTLLGSMRAHIEPRAILPEAPLLPPGGVVGLFDAQSGLSLLPRAFDRPLLAEDRFTWAGDEWVSRRMELPEPPMTVAVAAPLSPFTRPFEEASGRAAGALLTVAAAGLLLAALITRRLTRSMAELASAAESVAAGDLGRSIAVARDDEVGRAARAFNTMTESLRRTLKELADRESLAAMGDFAATLAHEVRNPLTAIRIDMERVEEGLPQDSPLRSPHERALREVERLDDTVSKALSGIRRARPPGICDLRKPLLAAADAAGPEFATADAVLQLPEMVDPLPVSADEGALEQLFLNLLRNAAQALDSGGVASVSAQALGEEIAVLIRDSGPGIPEGEEDRIFEPLVTTRKEGTGLGLTIARRIASSHGGTVVLENHPDGGAIARITLPRWTAEGV
jgi:signal transduction histidine kinase